MQAMPQGEILYWPRGHELQTPGSDPPHGVWYCPAGQKRLHTLHSLEPV